MPLQLKSLADIYDEQLGWPRYCFLIETIDRLQKQIDVLTDRLEYIETWKSENNFNEVPFD